VKAYPGRAVQVTVKEGRVAFSGAPAAPGDSATIILETGMSGILEPGNLFPAILPTVTADQEFWIDSSLVFRQTELNQVFNLIYHHYGVSVLMTDTSLGRCRLTASFQGESADMILKVIAETFNLQLSVRNNTFILTGNGCTP
jgi:ferric-dicitrate binding protein FerR (iron transport regulator)